MRKIRDKGIAKLVEQATKASHRGPKLVGYDYLVKDQRYLPKPLSTAYVKGLKERLGEKMNITVVKSETSYTAGWSYTNYTVLQVASPGWRGLADEPHGWGIAFTLHIKEDEEASGVVRIGPRDLVHRSSTTMPVPRARDPEQVIAWMLGEVSSFLGG